MLGYKVNCPHHEDHTASCHIYPDGRYYCFGCGAKGLSDKLVTGDNLTRNKSTFYRNGKEDLQRSLRYINNLPKKLIRGLMLPYDDKAYYVVFPLGDFYLKRFISPPKGVGKYLGPRGHVKPLYRAVCMTNATNLILVEGQLNALTAFYNFRDGQTNIASPGAATDFNRKHTVEYCLRYPKVCLIVDKDAAGVAAGIQLQQTLRQHGKQCVIYAMEKDLNQVLCEHGQEEVTKEINKALELLDMQARGLHMRTLGEGATSNDT